ncbi:hypothetical protein Tco_0958867 [Tanacetum coccineum]
MPMYDEKPPWKLNPRYIGPFKIIAKVGTVAYRLELPEKLSRVHSTFHVSKLKKCMADEPLAIPLDEIQVDDKLNFIEEPVEVMDRKVEFTGLGLELNIRKTEIFWPSCNDMKLSEGLFSSRLWRTVHWCELLGRAVW